IEETPPDGASPTQITLSAIARMRATLNTLRDVRISDHLRRLRDTHRIDLVAPAPCPACRNVVLVGPETCGLCGGSKIVSNALYYTYLASPDLALSRPDMALEESDSPSDPCVIPIERYREARR